MSPDELRQRFAAATDRHLTGELVPGVTLRHVTAAEQGPYIDALWAGLDVERSLELAPLLSDDEQAFQRGMAATFAAVRLEHRILLVAGDEVIGAYWGVQEDQARYGMVNSVIRSEHQGRGLYRALLPRVIAAVHAAGFTEILSRHRADNNPILVPKLKAGFVISGFEISPRHGLLVVLRLFCNEGVRRVFSYRVAGNHAADLRGAGVKLP